MKKAAVDFAAGGVRTAMDVADKAFNWRVFEANAQAYLLKSIAPDVFADICSAALKSPLAISYGHTIYKYRYLALMDLERYYEAFLDAQVIGGVFQDELSCNRMLCSIYFKRNNFDRALDCLNKMLTFARRHNLDSAELVAERCDLLRFIKNIKAFSALDFCREIKNDPQEAQRKYAGSPVRLTGPAYLAVNQESKDPFLVFDLAGADNDTGLTHIYGRAEPCEIPFLQGHTPGAPLTMLGYFLGVADNAALFNPCYFVD